MSRVFGAQCANVHQGIRTSKQLDLKIWRFLIQQWRIEKGTEVRITLWPLGQLQFFESCFVAQYWRPFCTQEAMNEHTVFILVRQLWRKNMQGCCEHFSFKTLVLSCSAFEVVFIICYTIAWLQSHSNCTFHSHWDYLHLNLALETALSNTIHLLYTTWIGNNDQVEGKNRLTLHCRGWWESHWQLLANGTFFNPIGRAKP